MTDKDPFHVRLLLNCSSSPSSHLGPISLFGFFLLLVLVSSCVLVSLNSTCSRSTSSVLKRLGANFRTCELLTRLDQSVHIISAQDCRQEIAVAMASKNGNGNGKKAPPSAAVNLIGTLRIHNHSFLFEETVDVSKN